MANQKYLQTIRGPVPAEDLGLILPHEHIFTDLRGPLVPDYAQEASDNVVTAFRPYLDAAYSSGVTALVECSTLGVGRNIQILQAVSEITPIHIIAPTGVYRDDYIPPSLRELSPEQMADLWVEDLIVGMEGTASKAGFIKISISDDGPRAIEEEILKAAAQASNKTGAVVASHTPNGEIFKQQWRILEKVGLPPEKFIWVHANLETDFRIHLEAAKIGVFVEYDGVGAQWQSQDVMINYTLSLVESGYIENVLLSHDAGWYQPGQPGGEPEGGYRGFTALSEQFIPRLRAEGLSEEELFQITHHNPVAAFGFDSEEHAQG